MFSIIIPAYNAEEWISETLDSVYPILKTDKSEVILVDDGSTDGTVSVIRADFSSVCLLQQKNSGVSAARNYGFAQSQGDYIQFLDADDLLMPDKLTLQLHLLESSGADVAYGDWQRLRQKPDGSWYEAETEERTIQAPNDLSAFTDFWCPLAAFLFRRSIVEKAGGFRADLPVIQDARFIVDCALAGAKFVKSPGIAAKYRTHQSDSVSTRSRHAFINDCYVNAQQVFKIWQERNLLDNERRKAVLSVISQVLRASYSIDRQLFDQAKAFFRKLDHNAVPNGSVLYKIIAKNFGFETAEDISLMYSSLRKRVLRY